MSAPCTYFLCKHPAGRILNLYNKVGWEEEEEEEEEEEVGEKEIRRSDL
jgi:hypothetical protein